MWKLLIIAAEALAFGGDYPTQEACLHAASYLESSQHAGSGGKNVTAYCYPAGE